MDVWWLWVVGVGGMKGWWVSVGWLGNVKAAGWMWVGGRGNGVVVVVGGMVCL